MSGLVSKDSVGAHLEEIEDRHHDWMVEQVATIPLRATFGEEVSAGPADVLMPMSQKEMREITDDLSITVVEPRRRRPGPGVK